MTSLAVGRSLREQPAGATKKSVLLWIYWHIFEYPNEPHIRNSICRCVQPMAMLWKNTVAGVMLAGLGLSGLALAVEPIAPKSDSGQMQTPQLPVPPQAPAVPKQHAQDAEMKPPVKSPALLQEGKEQPPSVTPGPVKPPTKATHPPNGNTPPKAATMPQPPGEIVGKDGAPMVLIPVGEFTMGSDKGDDDEQPIHKVFLDSFYIDKFEVTNGRFAKFVEAIQSEPPWGFADKETPVIRPDQPVRWVNWMEAIGYCLWAGKRLPTEAEWEKAARGPDGRVYPWGNDTPTPAHAVFGLKEGTDTVSAIGNRDKGKSPYGVHDLAGNLYEWTTDWYDEEFYSKNPAINPKGPLEGTAKVQRGGSYINGAYRLRSSFRTKGDPTEHDPNVGFRCAEDVPKQP
jgi:sulfatase modifying factor 1